MFYRCLPGGKLLLLGNSKNSKDQKELTRAGKKQEMEEVYLNSKVHRRVEKNKMGFFTRYHIGKQVCQ